MPERRKADVWVGNTLTQLHWLHRSVNTQFREALIASIRRVWIYTKQIKVPLAPTLSCIWVCVHRVTMLRLKFPSVHSLIPCQSDSEAGRATALAGLPKQYASFLAAGWRSSQLIRAPRHTRPLTLGIYPGLIRSVLADHKWKMALPAAMPITATQKSGRRLGRRFYQSKPSIHLDRWAAVATGGAVGAGVVLWLRWVMEGRRDTDKYRLLQLPEGLTAFREKDSLQWYKQSVIQTERSDLVAGSPATLCLHMSST